MFMEKNTSQSAKIEHKGHKQACDPHIILVEIIQRSMRWREGLGTRNQKEEEQETYVEWVDNQGRQGRG